MMTSSNGNIFRATGPFWGESTGDRWIPLKKASDAEFWRNTVYLCMKSRRAWKMLDNHQSAQRGYRVFPFSYMSK